MSICAENKKIASQVWEFISFVDNVGEESITDYLVWQWRKQNKKFKYISVDKHTKHKENTTSGADFELELWILTNSMALPLVFQAKKLIEEYNSYASKLSYKAAKGVLQVDKLISFSKSAKKYPFYIFYAIASEMTSTRCKMNESLDEIGLFITDAMSVKKIISKNRSKRLSKSQILSETTPFHCLFCCPIASENISDYINMYFPNLNELEFALDSVPRYVEQIASEETENIYQMIEENELQRFRNVGVIDLRYDKVNEF